MNTYHKSGIFALLLAGLVLSESSAQDKLYSLDACISYALDNSTTIGRASNQIESETSALEQSKAERGPNLLMSGSETISSLSSGLNFSLNSSLTLYNGAKLKNAVLQGKTNLQAAENDIQTQEELISLVLLMQIMNMPANNAFDIQGPEIKALLLSDNETDASEIYNVALGLQPGIKTAELEMESADLDIKRAKAEALPALSLTGGINSWYSSSQTDITLVEQLSGQINPSLGLSLSIPIYQRKKVKNNIKQAEIQYENYQYNLVDIKNDLRKAIEQACTDALTAQSTYDSRTEQLEAEQESYRLAEEMFAQGLVNAVDYLTSKNNLTTAENNQTQSKYNMILQNRIVNYYLGNPIKF